MVSVRVYLLGAGASYGYDPSLPSLLRPPLTKDFFVKGVEWGILTEERYPALVRRLKTEHSWQGTNQQDDLEKIHIDIEPFLAKIGREFEEGKPDAQAVLGEAAYYILDLLKRYHISGQNRYDCYRRLALSYLDTPYYVVTLNYDLLLESAASAVGLNYCYSEPVPPKTIPIAKIHGSISWLNQVGKALAFETLRPGDTPAVAKHIYSNTFKVEPPIVLPFQAAVNLTDYDIVRAGNDYYEPILIPPQGEFKDYDKFDMIKTVWGWAQRIMRFADELVIIGCSLRNEDAELWKLISSLKPGTKITLVNPHAEELAKRILQENSKVQIREAYKEFREYAKTL